MKPYEPNQPGQSGAVRIMHTLRPGKRMWDGAAVNEVEQMAKLHGLLEEELGISLSRNDVLRLAVHRSLVQSLYRVYSEEERRRHEPS